ncbi:hypothetical protein [Aquiflexum sp.]|uniref:hypothetical protein n=1 Tax=Aquiflexum sp. TaxID=1872584 RepID=UPI0035946350
MKKILVGILVLLVLAVLILRGLPYLINIYLNQNAARIVTNMITRTSDFGDHEVSFGAINLDYNFSGTYLKISNIKVTPTERIDDNRVKVNLSADNVNVTGFKWIPFLFHNSISVDSATLNNIKIISSTPPLDSMKREPNKQKEKASKDYDMIEVGIFELREFSIEVKENLNDSVRISLRNFNVDAQGFQLSIEDINNPESLFHVDKIHGEIDEAVFHFDRFRQYVAVRDILLDTEERNMSFGYMGLLNKLDKYDYTSQFKERQGWLELDKAEMELKGVNFGSFLRKGIIEIDTVFANNFQLESFVDKRIPEDKLKRTQMIHEVFQNLQQVLHIEHLFLNNAFVRIEERPENQSPRSGTMFFSELNAHVTNVSNYIDRRGDNRTISIDANGKLMGEGQINALIQYDLEDPEGKFTLKGTLEKMDLTVLNSMMGPEAKAILKSGTVDRLDFNILANDYEGSGEVIIRYQNLEIELLNKDFEQDQNLLRKIGAFIANRVIIKSNNPNNRGELKKGSVYFIRVPHKPMFNYWWQLIFSGLKSTLSGESVDEMRQNEIQKRSGNSDSKTTGSSSSKNNTDDQNELTRKEKRQARRESNKKD